MSCESCRVLELQVDEGKKDLQRSRTEAGKYRYALERIYKRLNDTVAAGYNLYPELNEIAYGALRIDFGVHMIESLCDCGAGNANDVGHLPTCKGWSEKRVDEYDGPCPAFVTRQEHQRMEGKCLRCGEHKS